MKGKITIRKIILILILLIAIFLSYEVIFGKNTSMREKIKSISQLKQASETLEQSAQELDSITLDSKKEEISKTIEEYKNTKTEYNGLIQTLSAEKIKEIEEGNVYDIGFLWTIIGNYATEEGVDLLFIARKNPNEQVSENKSYASCYMEFAVAGDYVNLTEFLYDLEDDERLGYEINNFKMEKNDNTEPVQGDLKVNFKVRKINLYKDNLTEDGVYWITEAGRGSSTTQNTTTVPTQTPTNTN